jgi:orc1/cdc6 family replication initiation protein
MNENAIIKDIRVLTEHFIPSRIIHRDGQLKTIRDDLKPILDDQKPRNIFLYGNSGTGKTCISKYVVEELRSYSSILHSYVNCWEFPSRFKILFNILQDLGFTSLVHRKGTPTDELLDSLRNRLKGKYGVIILDEVDQLEDDKVLYDLLQFERVCLILISNSETALYRVDPRIRSRLASLDSVSFPSYKTDEIFDILKDRVEFALFPFVVKNSQLERIAEISNGDARVAIDILRVAAEQSESSDLSKISDKSIDHALSKVQFLGKSKTLNKLNVHQKILYQIIKEKGKIKPLELYKEFYSRCKLRKVNPLVERTLRKYLEKMVYYGLIHSQGKGRWRSYSV